METCGRHLPEIQCDSQDKKTERQKYKKTKLIVQTCGQRLQEIQSDSPLLFPVWHHGSAIKRVGLIEHRKNVVSKHR